MSGLKKILKKFGEVKVTDQEGNTVTHVYDYAKNEPRLKSEMTKEEFAESERVKWTRLITQLKQ